MMRGQNAKARPFSRNQIYTPPPSKKMMHGICSQLQHMADLGIELSIEEIVLWVRFTELMLQESRRRRPFGGVPCRC